MVHSFKSNNLKILSYYEAIQVFFNYERNDKKMIPPIISYVTFNRLGLTVKSLTSLLGTTDDFELHIIDNKSTDGTWQFIQSLNDSRIKTRTHIDINAGLIYSLNINLSKRRPEQYFITLDNDVCIETEDWISKFMKVFEKFPEVGLLGVEKAIIYPKRLPPIIHKKTNGIAYIEIENEFPDVENNSVPGNIICLRPELLNEIGYFSEENCFGTTELCYRVNNHTNYKTGFVSNIKIKMPQEIECINCQYANKCILDKETETCISKYNKLNKNNEFMDKFKWKLDETIIDLQSGARPVYSASANDGNSTSNNIFNMEWAMDNFDFFIKNAN